MKYSAAALAAAVAVARAAPVDAGCKTVVSVVYGAPVWYPTPAATSWAAWSSTTSKKPDASTKTETVTWSEWDPSKTPDATTTASASSWAVWETTTSKKTDPTSTTSASWGEWESTTSKKTDPTSTTSASWSEWETTTSKKTDPTSTTSASWSEWETTTSATPVKETTTKPAVPTTTKAYTTTAAPTTTTAATTTAATTTSAPAPAATCGTSKSTFGDAPSGSCGCDFTTYCNQGATPDANTKFWEQTSGALVNSLAECQALCNSNDKCEAVIWTDSSSAGAQDFKRCWQTSGLPAASKDSYGQLSYKGSCKATCSDSYGAQY